MSRSGLSSVVICAALAASLAACGGGDDDDGGGGRVDSAPFADSAPTVDGTPAVDGGPTVDGSTASGDCTSPATFTVGSASTGTTVGRPASAFEGSCAFGESGSEVTYTFTAPMNGTLNLSMASDADLGVYVTTACGDATTELGCADNEFGGSPEALEVEVVSGTTYYIVVDGFSPEDSGTFELSGRLVDFAGLCGGAATAFGAGTTVGGTLEFDGFCTGVRAPSALYAYTPGVTGETGDVTVTLASTADLGVYARSTCSDQNSEIYCGDTQVGGTNEVLRFPVDGGVPLTLFVDGFVPGAAGTFTLDVAYAAATCGNNVREGKEACDAAALPTATCSATCTTITPTTEINCNDLVDDDGDDAPDCRDIDCGCVAGAGALASACDAPSDCAAGGSDPFCFDFATFGWPSGMCTQYCDPADTSGAECGAGNVCLPTTTIAAGTGICFKACTNAATDCPSANYHCEPVGAAATPVCWPSEICGDARDNSSDGHADCDDVACAGMGACAAATEVEPNNDAATATAYAAGFRGSIGEAGDIDWVAVTVPGPSSTITAKMGDAGGGGCAAFSIDSYVEIYAADGTTQLAANEDQSYTNYCGRAGASGLAAGTYYVVAQSSAFYAMNDTFNYTLDVAITP